LGVTVEPTKEDFLTLGEVLEEDIEDEVLTQSNRLINLEIILEFVGVLELLLFLKQFLWM
jgi:hypothetical protein